MTTLDSRTNVRDENGVPTVFIVLRPGERVHVVACDSGCTVMATKKIPAEEPVTLTVSAERLFPAPTLEDAILAASQR